MKNTWYQTWAIHNIVAHPVSQILFMLGFKGLSKQVHDMTVPPAD